MANATNATNANIMKEKNKRLIINLIRRDELSRAEISRRTSLTKAAVTIIVDDLIRNNIVYEYKSVKTEIGRRPLRLKVNTDFLYAIGLNITRNYAEFGIVNIGGEILCEKKVDVHPKKEALRQITDGIEQMIRTSGIDEELIYGIGVTAPGPIDVENTTILNPTNFEEWHYENIGSRLKKTFQKRVYIENVSGGLALCEKYFGKAKEITDFLLLKVDEGVGSGIMTSDKLLRNASELGHTSIDYRGIKCECGNVGCVEKYAAIPNLLKDSKYKTWREVVDAEDTELIEKEADYLSCAIINAINIFGFESIIFGGEINYNPKTLIDSVKNRLKKNAIMREEVKIIPGSSFSEVLGAASVVFDNYFNKF